MKFTAGHIVALVLGLAAIVALDRWSGRSEGWKEKVAEAARTARVEDSAQNVADSLKHAKDSLRHVRDSAVQDSMNVDHNRLAMENGRLRVRLSNALARNDTSAIVTEQAAVIVNQDRIIKADSVQKGQLRATVASQRETIADLNTSLADVRRRLADLIGVAERPPKEFKLLGFSLSLKPYIGVGANVSPAGKVSTGLQLGVSILRG